MTLCPPLLRCKMVVRPNFVVMHRLSLLLLVLLLALPSLGQGLMQRKRPDIIPLDGKVRRGGFYVAPGATWTLTRFKNSEEEVFRSGDTTFTATYDPNGRLGLYLEAGWYYATRDPVVLDYWDVGLAYKNLRGSERFTGLWHAGDLPPVIVDPPPGPPPVGDPPPPPPQPDPPAPPPPEDVPGFGMKRAVLDTAAGEGTFAERFVTLHVNANKFIQVRDYQFVQLSLGVNVDYRIGSRYEHSGDPVLNRHAFPPDLIGQLHAKVGYGFKPTGGLLVIPTLETPIFSVVPEDQGLGQLQWFSSRYRPIILSVRFLFLRAPKGFSCPPVIKHNDFEKKRVKEYKPKTYHP